MLASASRTLAVTNFLPAFSESAWIAGRFSSSSTEGISRRRAGGESGSLCDAFLPCWGLGLGIGSPPDALLRAAIQHSIQPGPRFGLDSATLRYLSMQQDLRNNLP